jgi:hypothetical protein
MSKVVNNIGCCECYVDCCSSLAHWVDDNCWRIITKTDKTVELATRLVIPAQTSKLANVSLLPDYGDLSDDKHKILKELFDEINDYIKKVSRDSLIGKLAEDNDSKLDIFNQRLTLLEKEKNESMSSCSTIDYQKRTLKELEEIQGLFIRVMHLIDRVESLTASCSFCIRVLMEVLLFVFVYKYSMIMVLSVYRFFTFQ